MGCIEIRDGGVILSGTQRRMIQDKLYGGIDGGSQKHQSDEPQDHQPFVTLFEFLDLRLDKWSAQ